MGVWSVALWMAIRVQAAGDCPAAAEVERLLAPLLPSGVASAIRDVAAFEQNADGGLTLSLARFDRGTITRRILPPAPSCGEQAETVAVALAVWEAEIHPSIALRLDRLPARLTAPPRAAAPPGPEPVLRRTIDPPPAGGWAAAPALGAGLVGAWSEGSLAPGARVDATLGAGAGQRDSAWRARLSLVALGPHAVSVPPGEASWWRAYLTLGGDHSWSLAERWTLTAGLGGLLGIARLAGTGYPVNHQVVSTDVGGEALVRVGRRAGRIRPWLGLAVVAWLRSQRLNVGGAGTDRALSRWEPMASLGADFHWGP